MNIVRKKQRKNFTTVSNDYLNDKILSWKAKGIITYVMMLPDDWELNMADLQNRAKDGRDSLYSGIQELRDNGYCRSIQKKDNGLFSGIKYEIADYKAFSEEVPQTENPDTVNPDTVNPDTVKPDTGNPQLLITNKNKGLNEVKTNSKASPSKKNESKTLFRNSIYGDDNGKILFFKSFDKPDYSGVDINFYYHSVKDWSDSADKKRTEKGWLATARNFMRSDKTNNKLKMNLSEKENLTDADILNYLKGYE